MKLLARATFFVLHNLNNGRALCKTREVEIKFTFFSAPTSIGISTRASLTHNLLACYSNSN
eukprot:2408605-Amphidinium_carterae.1